MSDVARVERVRCLSTTSGRVFEVLSGGKSFAMKVVDASRLSEEEQWDSYDNAVPVISWQRHDGNIHLFMPLYRLALPALPPTLSLCPGAVRMSPSLVPLLCSLCGFVLAPRAQC